MKSRLVLRSVSLTTVLLFLAILSFCSSFHPIEQVRALSRIRYPSSAVDSPSSLNVLTTKDSILPEVPPSPSLPSIPAPPVPVTQPTSVPQTIDLWYDSGCPICNMEVEYLKKRDVQQTIRFTDIADPNQRGKVRYIDGMKRLRATLPDQRVVVGREVFKQTYEVLGLGWFFTLTRLPLLSSVMDVVYDTWTESQLRLKGENQLAEKYRQQAEIIRSLPRTTIDPVSDRASYTSLLEGQIDLLYDSECPICNMEVEFLKKRDIYQRIRFTDISSPFYDPKQHGNVQYVDGMKKLRAVLPDNRVITGVEVFRYTYEAIGLGWVFAATKWPVIGQVADAVYDVWAENRLRITGRHDLAEKLKAQAEALKSMELEECENTCDLDEEEEEIGN